LTCNLNTNEEIIQNKSRFTSKHLVERKATKQVTTPLCKTSHAASTQMSRSSRTEADHIKTSSRREGNYHLIKETTLTETEKQKKTVLSN
jgi:hypothetical protein